MPSSYARGAARALIANKDRVDRGQRRHAGRRPFRGHVDLSSRTARGAVPRYTSYPTAAEFTDAVRPADIHAALTGIAKDETVSLYVHIPYCRQICWYCGCSTCAAWR
ncbi:hypothetical protein E5673_10920 [Sphingomonas sp. PAMC26645]|uniref:hypothetical protein n=1 Tax=Sphingomonas sp. PAMC26645 TaxID=2565555 RepID=UPI00109DF5CA|nr:hypothetical protein E5673_10920 [Sphingomonas sp. PAMC26645]